MSIRRPLTLRLRRVTFRKNILNASAATASKTCWAKGGFGLVYLAQDEQLDRLVANKVPHANLISKPEDAQAYLAEARTVANLDQGSTDEFPCYVVSSNSRTRRRIGCCVTLNRCAGNQYLGRETR